jgi:hypothetical protein
MCCWCHALASQRSSRTCTSAPQRASAAPARQAPPRSSCYCSGPAPWAAVRGCRPPPWRAAAAPAAPAAAAPCLRGGWGGALVIGQARRKPDAGRGGHRVIDNPAQPAAPSPRPPFIYLTARSQMRSAPAAPRRRAARTQSPTGPPRDGSRPAPGTAARAGPPATQGLSPTGDSGRGRGTCSQCVSAVSAGLASARWQWRRPAEAAAGASASTLLPAAAAVQCM